jgi:hypothetical protein
VATGEGVRTAHTNGLVLTAAGALVVSPASVAGTGSEAAAVAGSAAFEAAALDFASGLASLDRSTAQRERRWSSPVRGDEETTMRTGDEHIYSSTPARAVSHADAPVTRIQIGRSARSSSKSRA